MPAARASTARDATAPMAPDSPEESPDLWPGAGNGNEVAESPVGGTELLEEVVVAAKLAVFGFTAKVILSF